MNTHPTPVQAHRIDISATDAPQHFIQGMDEDLVQLVESGDITLRRAKAQQQERDAQRIYIETTGTTAHVGGERGTVTGVHRLGPDSWVGAFVKLDERPAMLYVEGIYAGNRRQYMTVTSSREIDRDEFDRITGLDQAREGMGWR
jgi:hypothetical protein